MQQAFSLDHETQSLVISSDDIQLTGRSVSLTVLTDNFTDDQVETRAELLVSIEFSTTSSMKDEKMIDIEVDRVALNTSLAVSDLDIPWIENDVSIFNKVALKEILKQDLKDVFELVKW